MQKSEPEKHKKQYEKPELRQVELRPEEAVLGNCKVGNTGGPNGGSCTSPGSCTVIGT